MDEKEKTKNCLFEVSPLEFRFSLDDTESLEKSLTVRNPGTEPIEVRFFVGSPSGLENPAYSRLPEWITLEKTSFSVVPGKTREVSFKVTRIDEVRRMFSQVRVISEVSAVNSIVHLLNFSTCSRSR